MAKNEIHLRGRLRLEVPEDGSKALIHIERASDGQEITEESVLALAKSRNILERISSDDLARNLRQFAGTTDVSCSFEIAHAKAATAGTAESAEIGLEETPGEVADTVARVVEESSAPEIYVESAERVKTSKVVSRKSPLPFLPAKKETVESFEKRVTRRRVYVDPAVLGTGWAKAGEKIGNVAAGKIGEPGKDVLGRPISPPTHPDPFYYVGTGVERKRDELFASETGIVRWGKNWVEVIPFHTHDWSVTISPDKATCFLSFTPGHVDAPRPDAVRIADAAIAAGFPKDALRSLQEIENLVGQAIRHGRPVENVPICKDSDASVELTISDDKMTATLNVRKGSGRGAALRLKSVGSAITAANLKGLNLKQISADINAFATDSRLELKDYLLVEGKPPRRGADSVVDFSLRPLPEKELASQKALLANSAECAAPYSKLDTKHSVLAGTDAPTVEDRPSGPPVVPADVPLEFPADRVSEISRVQNEQRILSFSMPTAGEPGVDVHGNPVAGVTGTHARIALYGALERRDNLVIATTDGMVDRVAGAGGSILLRVRRHSDAGVAIRVAPDNMQATISVAASEGCGKRIAAAEIDRQIAASGVRKGIDERVVSSAKTAAASGSALPETPFALGVAARPPGHRELRFLAEMASGKGVRILDDGTADFRNQDRISRVTAGADIAELLPPDMTATDGFDITGKVLPAGAAPATPVAPGPNVAIREADDGRTVFSATAVGELIYENGVLDVRSSHTVNGDVDLQSGNVKFSGPVTVTGTIRSGFFVMATGEVRIGGGVEAGLVSSDEDILIREGVRGAGKAVLRSKKNITAAFAEQAVFLSVGDVVFANACMQSRVKCNGKLLLRGDRGVVLGGSIQVRHGLEAQNIGSERGAATHISFGQNYLIADQIETELKAVESLKSEIARTEHQLGLAEHHRRTDELTVLFRRKTQLMKLLEQRSLKLFTLREKFEQHYDSEIRVRGTVFPGTVLESHGRTLSISSPRKAVVFSFNTTSGRIEEKGIAK